MKNGGLAEWMNLPTCPGPGVLRGRGEPGRSQAGKGRPVLDPREDGTGNQVGQEEVGRDPGFKSTSILMMPPQTTLV